MTAIPLSVLDLAPVASGSSSSQALRACVALAQEVERLGFTRFWVAEHHGMPGVASSAPAVLIAAVAGATRTIRVGSGGVMLPNHAPLVVAEQFGMLEGLHPGRIDLGLGRAPGTDQATAMALRRTRDLSAEDFPQEVLQLQAFFAGQWPAGHAYANLRAVPAEGNAPDLWLLGSSGFSAQLAGMLGLPFAFAHHFSGHGTEQALALYRDSFRAGALTQPRAMVTVSVIAADTDTRARELALPGALAFVRLRQGLPSTFPSEQEAAAHPWTAEERTFAESRITSQVVGGPDTVRAGLAELAARTGADELMVTTMTHDAADRLRSFALVAGVATAGEQGLALAA